MLSHFPSSHYLDNDEACSHHTILGREACYAKIPAGPPAQMLHQPLPIRAYLVASLRCPDSQWHRLGCVRDSQCMCHSYHGVSRLSDLFVDWKQDAQRYLANSHPCHRRSVSSNCCAQRWLLRCFYTYSANLAAGPLRYHDVHLGLPSSHHYA